MNVRLSVVVLLVLLISCTPVKEQQPSIPVRPVQPVVERVVEQPPAQPVVQPEVKPPQPKPSEYICSYNAYNCDAFNTHAEAQKVFKACGGTTNDIHHLDRDADGVACETLP